MGYLYGNFYGINYADMNYIKLADNVVDWIAEESLYGRTMDKVFERLFSKEKTNEKSGAHAIYIVGYDKRGLIINTWGSNYLIEWKNLDLKNVYYNIGIWDIKKGKL